MAEYSGTRLYLGNLHKDGMLLSLSCLLHFVRFVSLNDIFVVALTARHS
jgi:hypothetical protein